MRTGEINGLKWKLVDFENALILVRETFSDGEAEENAKTGKCPSVYFPWFRWSWTLSSGSSTTAILSVPMSSRRARAIRSTRTTSPTASGTRCFAISTSIVAVPTNASHRGDPGLAAGENPEWIARR